jgi:hypothetical protein
MKRTLLAGLSVLMLSALVSPAANATPQVEQIAKQSIETSNTGSYISPNTLVSSAYRGEFRDQGIPGYARLQSGRVSAESLVKAAIEAGRLSPEVLEDEGYLNVVEIKLMGLKG